MVVRDILQVTQYCSHPGNSFVEKAKLFGCSLFNGWWVVFGGGELVGLARQTGPPGLAGWPARYRLASPHRGQPHRGLQQRGVVRPHLGRTQVLGGTLYRAFHANSTYCTDITG